MPLLYLDADDVRAAMPPVGERLDLARRTMIALVEDAELPPKIGVHPRPAASHTAAMPALLSGSDSSGSDDLLGIKWVTNFPTNREMGRPAIHATVLLTDAVTGEPRAVLDGAPITAERTAAVSGVVLREWWPRDLSIPHVAMLGAGVQASSHVDVLAEVCRQVGAKPTLTIADRNLDRAQQLADAALASGKFAEADATTELSAAATGADVLLTMISFGTDRQILPVGTLARASLVVAVDYDMCIPAEFARRSSIFVTDDIGQFRVTRAGSVLAGYPDPDASIGEALSGRDLEPRQTGPTFVNHLGVGLADVVFADALVRRAATLGLGTTLPG
jgi:ornithine cyclodeaminase/alanine dehydrogenase-like protein (mu-crystallin family)